ncbi:G-protein coupled receptor dmsr-1-like [Liolophura sinensis]|uniref:G-protein coupled receptor dmsr-1-like n=1 Tax=Liolophura sinensis TaxID=3198878 RepID=UPI003158F043
MDNRHPLRSEALINYATWYSGWHGYISLVVCTFGIITNVFNIAVLTRKHMNTPINCILLWLAVSEIFTMISYVPFALHFYCFYTPFDTSPDRDSFEWMTYMLFHINFSATSHTVSIWLGVVLAIFRYHHIQSPAKGNITRMRRLIRARLVVCVIYASSAIVLIPNYLTNRIERVNGTDSIYRLEDLRLGKPDVKEVVLANLWLYGLLAKLSPCVLMVFYGGMLLRTLKSRIRAKRQRLTIRGVTKPIDHSRTTRMLLAVVVLFLVTELPQAVLIILSVTVNDFFEYIYMPLGDTMDIVALINNAVNFVLYCTMGEQFRKTFLELFCKFRLASDNKQPRIRLSSNDSVCASLVVS